MYYRKWPVNLADWPPNVATSSPKNLWGIAPRWPQRYVIVKTYRFQTPVCRMTAYDQNIRFDKHPYTEIYLIRYSIGKWRKNLKKKQGFIKQTCLEARNSAIETWKNCIILLTGTWPEMSWHSFLKNGCDSFSIALVLSFFDWHLKSE